MTEEELYTPGFSMSFHAVADHAVLDIWALDLTRERRLLWFRHCIPGFALADFHGPTNREGLEL